MFISSIFETLFIYLVFFISFRNLFLNFTYSSYPAQQPISRFAQWFLRTISGRDLVLSFLTSPGLGLGLCSRGLVREFWGWSVVLICKRIEACEMYKNCNYYYYHSFRNVDKDSPAVHRFKPFQSNSVFVNFIENTFKYPFSVGDVDKFCCHCFQPHQPAP